MPPRAAPKTRSAIAAAAPSRPRSAGKRRRGRAEADADAAASVTAAGAGSSASRPAAPPAAASGFASAANPADNPAQHPKRSRTARRTGGAAAKRSREAQPSPATATTCGGAANAAEARPCASFDEMMLLMEYGALVTSLAQRAVLECGLQGPSPWPPSQVMALAWLDGAPAFLHLDGYAPIRVGTLRFAAALPEPGRPGDLLSADRAKQLGGLPDARRLPALFLEPAATENAAVVIAQAAPRLCMAPMFVLSAGSLSIRYRPLGDSCGTGPEGIPSTRARSRLPTLFAHTSLLADVLLCRIGEPGGPPLSSCHLAVQWVSLHSMSEGRDTCSTHHAVTLGRRMLSVSEAVRRAEAFIGGCGSEAHASARTPLPLLTPPLQHTFPLRDSLPQLLGDAIRGLGAALPLPMAPSPEREPRLMMLLGVGTETTRALPPLPVRPLGGMCMILGEHEADAEDTLGVSPLTWVRLCRLAWHCEDCLDAAARSSPSGWPSFTIEALVGSLTASAGLRWNEATGDVFGRHPLMVPLLTLFFVPLDGECGCLCGATLSVDELDRAQSALAHGVGSPSEVTYALGRMEHVIDRIILAARARGPMPAADALVVYLRWCVDQVRISLIYRTSSRILRVERVDPHRPVGRFEVAPRTALVAAPVATVPASSGCASEAMPAATAASEARPCACRESFCGSGSEALPHVALSLSPPPSLADAKPWCVLCGMAPPCLHAVVAALSVTADTRDAEAREFPAEARVPFWREAALRYACSAKAFLIGQRGASRELADEAIPLEGAALEAAARFCSVLERTLQTALCPRCPTCSSSFALDEGCTHVRCTACDRHHCYVCGRRFASLDQPETSERLFQEARSVQNDLAAAADASGELPRCMRPCTMVHESEAVELFALTGWHERALLRSLSSSVSGRRFTLTERFSHAAFRKDGCPMFCHDALRTDGEGSDASLTGISADFALTHDTRTVYAELGERSEHGVSDPAEVGGGLMLRVIHQMISLSRRLWRVLSVPPDASPVRWAWPILLHAGGWWAAGQTEEQLREAPLTPLCFAWLLGVKMLRPRVVPDSAGRRLTPPTTLLERLVLSVAVMQRFVELEEDDMQQDEDGAERYPTAEAAALSLLDPLGVPHLYLRAGILDCAERSLVEGI